jgi:aldose 1-epimerase
MMTITVSAFGIHEGRRVDQFRLRSDAGVVVDLINYGAAIRDWRVPVAGGPRRVVLGFDSFEPYPQHSPLFGAVVGRVANRIAGASFELGDNTWRLPANEGANHLHGGPEGLAWQLWAGEVDSNGTSVRLTHLSPHGAMCYPGTVLFTATYRLAGYRLHIDLDATTDAPTPISLVQHSYFNLGAGPDILDHRLEVAAPAYTPLGADNCPTGVIQPVGGTIFDFRRPRSFRDAAGRPLDYDVGLVLDTGRQSAPAARLHSPEGDLALRLWTDRPGLQIFNSPVIDVAVPGHDGARYGRYCGVALEDQALVDAVHHPHFPSIIHTPERPYQHRCAIEVGPSEIMS